MDFEFNATVTDLVKRVTAFRDEYIYPNESSFSQQVGAGDTRPKQISLLEELRKKAKEQGLWNLSLQDKSYGPGLSNFEYAPIAEVMGCNEWAPEVFNCNPPDTGNIGILAAYGSEEQKDQWLKPLLNGEIRSCFAMTERSVASSDATNISTRAEVVGGEWLINGEKWWISGPGSPLCKIAIVMCRSNPDGERHRQHSMILVPLDTPGVVVSRQLTLMGFDFAPRGFSALAFNDARVPLTNTLSAPGMGFEIAQGRLGPGRVHHAMRCVGAAERALELMCRRGLSRNAFGKQIAKLGGNGDMIAKSRIEINMLRQFVLRTAATLDAVGPAQARSEISQIKVAAPRIACRVVDRAIQIHGAAGLSQDTPLAALYARLRSLRIADGPDEVHLRVIAKEELSKYD